MARANDIPLSNGFDKIAQELGHTSTLIGAALRFLTDDAVNQAALKTSLQTLTRVLDVVDWQKVSKGDPEAWLYFYEDFLEIYDHKLRKQTGSYYTPPQVVATMVRLVDDELRSVRFGLHRGVASREVTLADPATGTGTFLLGILRKIAETVEADEGPGAVKGAINDAIQRLIAFEIQLGPFAVAQLRVFAEIVDLTGAMPPTPPRMFVANTLDDPEDDQGWIPGMLAPIASSRRDANKIKREEPITVVIGNPPYKEKAKGLGGWVEGQASDKHRSTPLKDWMPPSDWGVGAHAKHLRNLYIYFWRWATWKVFDHDPANNTGIVCFITMAGFLNGPGFQKMRDYLRRKCDRIWIVDCSPEGHQPGVNTRIFEGVQQPVCIVLASRSTQNDATTPAAVRWRALPAGHRFEKFKAMEGIALDSKGWIDCPKEWRAPFLPASLGTWSDFPAIEDLFSHDSSGVMPGRTWVIAPDPESLERRWQRLIDASSAEKEALFHPHLRNGKPGDKHTKRVVRTPLVGFPARPKPIADEQGAANSPVRYGYRSFDRQWIVPDSRLINQPNPMLWGSQSGKQVYLTALTRTSPSAGPALTVTGLIPDLDHYKGSFGGRVFPLWRDRAASVPNVEAELIALLRKRYRHDVDPEDAFAYVVATAAHSAFTARFRADLSTPGLRIPLTADAATFKKGADLGRAVIWLHTFGERMADPRQGRPAGPPRLPVERRPHVTAKGAIPQDPARMPDAINYDGAAKRLMIGSGYVENVTAEMWNYEVSGKHVLRQWFSYRQKNRERPIIGDRRQPSPLSFVQPDHWLAEYTTELLNVINVLGLLVDLEPKQAALLTTICDGELISVDELRVAGVLESPRSPRGRATSSERPTLFD